MIYAVLIVAAAALGLAAFAAWLAWTARGRAIDAQKRTARHQQEHRLGLEDTGLRRHRAVEEPVTEQLAAQRPRPAAGPATALAGSTTPETGPYARLRQPPEQLTTADLPVTVESPAAHPRRPGSAPNFAEPAPRPTLPPPGRIDRQ
jgi:cell division protein FtsL